MTAWTVLRVREALEHAGLTFDTENLVYFLDGEPYVTLAAIEARPDAIGEIALDLISIRVLGRGRAEAVS